MKKFLNLLLVFLGAFEFSTNTKSSYAFIPRVNEPNEKELISTSIQIARAAIQLIKFGQTEEAIKLLELAIKLNPKEENLWTTLGEAQIRLNKNKEAIFSLNQSIELKPKKESLYFTKSIIYMNLNNPKFAIKIIKKGLSINNQNARGYFLLGNSKMMLKNYKSALIDFQKSYQIKSDFWQSINNEGLVLYELNNPEKAISKFRLAVEISKDAEPMLALAIALFTLDNNSIESINLAKMALKSNPKYVSTEYQSKQLWGIKLQKKATYFFQAKEMVKAVEEAEKNSQ